MLIALILTGCAERSKPAPVVSLTNSSSNYSPSKTTISGSSYKVKSGETLYSIAWRSGQDTRTLANLNNLKPPYKIFVGQTLQLKPKVTKTASSSPKQNKSTNNSVKNTQKSGSKNVAKQKTQEYGEDSGGKFTGVKVPSLTQKVKKWVWPVKGKIISNFSSAAQGNKGIDIAGNKGTSIKAAADGLIVYAGNALRGYGNLIIIKHNDDYLSAYAHNDTLLVKEQQTVKANQVIAKMGNTGTNRTMLHFEIRFRGKSVNPKRYLP
ncbi:peptidoglycan DD-metalloendopeptidase family protein [Thalassomonas sp. M1454]|uniref:peptidoglycan DD-metalloendopeptidase family protein n=1 Tax=Thalassomonas sp. M1454 TaxID=2594477 RepID=UPI0021B0F792|nr:peptidoglycan DD-metalloendopeptidase family protein [Thalassomonas sp. M1454]